MTAGPDGTVWIGTSPATGPINGSPSGFIRVTTDGVFLDFTPTSPNGYPSAGTVARDGNLYALVGNGSACTLERFSAAGAMTPVSLGSSVFIQACDSLTTGPDGLLWLIGSTFSGSSIVKAMVSVDPGTLAVSVYPTPAAGYLTAGPDEGIWFNSLPSGVGRFDIGGGPARAFVTPSVVGFPTTGLGIPSPLRTVTVQSTGTAPLTVHGVSLGGANPGQFAIAGDGCSGVPLAPGASCTVSIASVPTVAGSHTATLVISDDDVFSPQEVTLAEYTIPPQPQAAPTSVAFPATVVGQHTAASTFTLKNLGDRPLSVTSAILSGTDPGDFQIVTDLCSATSVPVGGSCTVTVRFAPTVAGPRTATLVFTDLSISITQTVALTGGGQPGSGSGSGCQCASAGPFVDPVVVDPVNSSTSPNGLFTLSATIPSGAVLLTITNASGATVLSFPAPAGATWPSAPALPWGFSPDGNRFVVHYAYQGSDYIALYNLTAAQPSTPVWSHSLPMVPGGDASSPSGSVGFSPAGDYLAATQIQSPVGGTQTMYLSLVQTSSGLSTTLSWIPVSAPGDSDTVVGSASWGFSPDGQSFTFIRLESTPSQTLTLISLPSFTVVQEQTFSDAISFYVQFAPCGEVLALHELVGDPGNANPPNPVTVSLFSTAAADAHKGPIATPVSSLPAADTQFVAGPAHYTATFTGWSNIVTLAPNLTSGGACAPPTATSSGGGSAAPGAYAAPVFSDDTPPMQAYRGHQVLLHLRRHRVRPDHLRAHGGAAPVADDQPVDRRRLGHAAGRHRPVQLRRHGVEPGRLRERRPVHDPREYADAAVVHQGRAPVDPERGHGVLLHLRGRRRAGADLRTRIGSPVVAVRRRGHGGRVRDAASRNVGVRLQRDRLERCDA